MRGRRLKNEDGAYHDEFQWRVDRAKGEVMGKGSPRTAASFGELIDEVHELLKAERSAMRATIGPIVQFTREHAPRGDCFRDRELLWIPSQGEVIVVGDTHGDLEAVSAILSRTSIFERLEHNPHALQLVFLGDYADRGKRQVENVQVILALKLKYPHAVHLLRGNHEERQIGIVYGFSSALEAVYGASGQDLFMQLADLYNDLPGAAVCANGLFLVHGGIPSEDIRSLADLQDRERLTELRWNDPDTQIEERGDPGHRGHPRARRFGARAFDRFRNATGITALLRGHEAVPEGFQILFDGRLATLFSSGSPSPSTAYPMVRSPKYFRTRLDVPHQRFLPEEFLPVFPAPTNSKSEARNSKQIQNFNLE